MRASASPGGTHPGDHLLSADLLTGAHVDGVTVGVEGLPAAAVIDDHRVAKAAALSSKHHLATADWPDFGSRWSGNVQTTVHPLVAMNGINAMAKVRADPTANRNSGAAQETTDGLCWRGASPLSACP